MHRYSASSGGKKQYLGSGHNVWMNRSEDGGGIILVFREPLLLCKLSLISATLQPQRPFISALRQKRKNRSAVPLLSQVSERQPVLFLTLPPHQNPL